MTTSNDAHGRRCTALVALVGCCLPAPAWAAEFGAAWTGDFGAVVDGGLRDGGRHMGLVELTFDHVFVPASREFALHVSAQHVYGGGFSESWVGDLQTVSNVDADTGTRVFEAWLDVPLADALSLKFGRYDLNSEFDAIEPAGLFLNSSQGIGADISQTGAAGPSIFPRTALGLRLQYDFSGRGLVRGAALDVESDPEAEYGDTPFLGGPMLALELESGTEATRWRAGAWRFTRSRAAMTEPADRDSEYGAYASVVRRIDGDWLTYARVGVANQEVSRLGTYVGGGLLYERGLLATREDVLGFSVAHARNGSPYRDAMQAAGVDTTAAETALELTWRVVLDEHVALQPDLQYVFDPDTNPALDDALVVMLRVELTL